MAADVKSGCAPVFLVGATGVGKSGVGMELVRAHAGAAILCMDAMQVYRGADIGTSKPSSSERAEVPHGGLDLVEFGTAFDVAQYLKHAAEFLREQRAAGRRVIIVGGTGLYFRALTRGLCEAPQGEEELRAELNALSTPELVERLKKVDPGMVERLDASNPRRLVRAIEVMESTGRSLRAWQEETPPPLIPQFRAFWIQREKVELEARIAVRVEAMFAQGWVGEVRGLVERYGVEAVRNFAGIGYREIGEAMEFGNEGNLTGLTELGRGAGIVGGPSTASAEADFAQDDRLFEKSLSRPGAGPATATQRQIEGVKGDILVATRQYAKRQLTWFGRETSLQQVMLSGAQPFPAALLSLS